MNNIMKKRNIYIYIFFLVDVIWLQCGTYIKLILNCLSHAIIRTCELKRLKIRSKYLII